MLRSNIIANKYTAAKDFIVLTEHEDLIIEALVFKGLKFFVLSSELRRMYREKYSQQEIDEKCTPLAISTAYGSALTKINSGYADFNRSKLEKEENMVRVGQNFPIQTFLSAAATKFKSILTI